MKTKLFRVLALAGAAMLCAPAMGLQSDPVTLAVPTAEDFGAVASLTQPVLSPDGKRIASKGLIKGRQLVVVAGTKLDPASVRTINMPEKQRLQWIRWAGPNRLLISLGTTTMLMGQPMPLRRLVMIDLATNAVGPVGPKDQGLFGDDVIHVDSQGKSLLLSTQPSIFEYPSVYRVNLDTGKSERVVRGREDVWSWFADANGIVRGGIGSSGRKWWLLYRETADGDFRRIQRKVGQSDTDIDKFMPMNGSDQGYAVAAGASGRFGLYRYDFKTDQLGERLYEHAAVDIDDFDLSADGSLSSVSFTDDRPEVLWFDPELKKLQAKIDRALPGKLNRVISASEDRKQLLVFSSAADDAGTYFFYDRNTNRMNAFGVPYERLLEKRLAPMEAVRYKARDGLEIRAYLTLPLGKGDKNLPLIVMPHGGPFKRDAWGYDPWVQYLATRGYAVLQPNFRGSTGFGRAFVEAGEGQWGRGMQDDIDDGVKWLAGRGTADAKRVCIMGASFGGYAAMWAAVRNPDLYRCAISFAGISDVASMLRYDKRAVSAPRYFRDWRARVQGDKDFALDQISPLKSAERLTVPILIAHGEDDDNVPVYQSRRLHEALNKLGRTHEYVVYKDEGHGFSDPVNATDFLSHVGKFLDKHNPS